MKYTPDFDFDSLPVLDAEPSGTTSSPETAPVPSADGQAALAQNASTPDFDFDSLPVLEEPVAQIQTMSPEDFKGRPNMGGATEQALMAQAQGGAAAEKDDGSISSWLKNAWNAFAHNASGRIASSDINWKTQRVMEGVAEKEGGKRVSFLDLPDAELDDYMNSIAPNGFWGYVGNAIGLGGRNDLMKEWDETQGAKIADPAERKKARVQYAMDVAKGVFQQTEEQKQFAQAELQGRGKQWQSGITGGAIQMAGYMAPALAPVVGMPLSAAVEGTARRNELLSDKYETDADGNVYKTAKGDTRGSALVRGAIGGTVQAAVEKYAGKVAGKIIGKIPGAAKVGDKVMSTAIGKAVGKFYRPFGKFFEKTGLDDAPSEFLEEFAQTAIDSTFGLDRRQSEMPDGMVSLERGLDATVDLVKNSGNLLESMLLVQLAGGGLAHMKNRLDANRILRDVVKVDPKKVKGYSTETKWRLIENHFNGMSEEQKVKVLEAGAKEADNLLHTIEKERLDSFEGRLQTVQAHKDAAKRIYEAREQGKDVSRRMLQEMGIDTELYPTVAERNALADRFLEDRTTYKMRQEAEAAIRRTKMDDVQRGALADEITALGIDAESKEYGGIWLNVANQISDAKELDDPVRRAELVQNALEQYVKENGELNVQFTTDDGATHERSWTYNPPKKETTDETRNGSNEAPAQPISERSASAVQEGQAPVAVPQGAQGAEANGVVKTSPKNAAEAKEYFTANVGKRFSDELGRTVELAGLSEDGKQVHLKVTFEDGSIEDIDMPVKAAGANIFSKNQKWKPIAETPIEAPTGAPSAEGAITQPKATESAEGQISPSDGTITPEQAAAERKKGKRIPKTAVKAEGSAPVVEKSGDEATISAPQSVEDRIAAMPRGSKEQLKAQHDYVTQEIAKAKAAIEGKFTPKKRKLTPKEKQTDAYVRVKDSGDIPETVNIKVPSDGEITVKNNPHGMEYLDKFAAKFKPQTSGLASEMSIPKPPSVKVADKPKAESAEKETKAFVSKDKEKTPFLKPYSVGDEYAYASDGRVIVRRRMRKGEKVAHQGDNKIRSLSPTFFEGRTSSDYSLDTAETYPKIVQALTFASKGWESKGFPLIDVFRGVDGKLQFRSRDDNGNGYATDAWAKTSTFVTSWNGEQLRDVLKLAAKSGAENIGVGIDENGVSYFKFGEWEAVMMPIKVNDDTRKRWDAEDAAESAARPEASAPADVAPKVNTESADVRERLARAYEDYAEEPLPKWADSLSDEDAAEYLRLVDAVMNQPQDDVSGKAYDALVAFEEKHEAAAKVANADRKSARTAEKAPEKAKTAEQFAPKPPKAQKETPKLTDDLRKRGIAATRMLSVESGQGIPQLQRTLKQLEKVNSPAAERKAQAIRDLIEYRKAVGENTDPQSDESSGGRWRGESILSQNNMEDDAAPDGIRPADFAMADPKRAATAIRQNLPKVDEEAADPMNASLNPNALKDPSFVEWAKKKGRAITAKNRRAYDAEQVKAAVPILRRVFPGLKVTYHDTMQDSDAWHAKHPNGIQRLIIDQKSGRTLGWFSPDMKEVHLNPGATVETLAHEVLHAAQDWAKKNNPKLAAALEKIAKECPRNLKQKIIRTYKTADADTLLKEWSAFNFMGEGGKALRAELAKRENASWLKKFWNAVKDIWKDMMAKMGFNRMDLSAIDSMSAKDAMAYLARGMASGMTIGRVDAKNKPPTAKIDMTQKPSKMEWYKTTAFDYRAPLKWLRDEMAKRGVQFSDDSDFYQAARLVVGENQRAFNEAQRRIADYQKMLDDSGIDHSDIVWYMQCLAAKDRNAMIKERNGKENGSGISDREAAEEIARMESAPNGAKYREIARFLQKMQREGLQFRVDSGLLDAETAQLWLDREPNHVPFRSAVDTESGEHIDWGNTQGQFNKKEFITAKGRQTFADDVVAWMFQEYLDAYTRGNENKLRGMIAEAIEISPSLGVGKVRKGMEKTYEFDYSAGPYKTTSDGNGVTGDKAKKALVNDPDYRESRRNGDGGKRNVLAFKRGGKAYFIEFAEGAMGEKLQAAVNGRDLKKMPNAWNKLMRGWAATATSLSPTFAIRNGVADSIDLYSNYVGDNGIIGGSKAYGNHLKNIKALSKALHKYIRTGKIPDGEMGKWIDRYEKAGGLIAGMKREGYEDMSKRLSIEFKGGKNRVAAVGSAILGGIDYMNRFSELANRLAAFKTQVEMGKTDKQAALWSRESTVDFNMKGNVTGVTNALWMFSNSTLGASARQIRALYKSKHSAQLAAGLIGLGLLEGFAESLFNDDDEREEKGEGTGKDVSEYTRANSIYYRAGGTVLRLPFHAGPFSLLKYVGNCTARLLCRKMSISEFAKALGKEGLGAALNFLPFGNINFDSQSDGFANDAKTAIGTAVPSIFQPFVQGAFNMDYAGRSIYNEAFSNDETPRSEQGRKGTASVWKWAAEALNEATREDGHLKGYVDLTPEVVKLAGESIGKNALRDVMGAVSVVNMVLQNEDWNVRNIPVARDFVRTTGGNDTRFYEARNEYRDNVNAYKKGDLTETEKSAYLKRFPHVGNVWFENADAKIKRYRKMEDGYAFPKDKAVPYEWSKDELKEIREKRLKLQAEFIRRMGR